MKVIVTGAGGFVGRQIASILLARGDTVTALDNNADAIPAGARVVTGDLCDAAVQKEALKDGCDALIHLATVPGGAAEADPSASRRVNIDAMYDLLERAASAGDCPRVVFASSIAVLGHPLPLEGVNDQTPLSPELIYGGHKAMMEMAVTMFSNRKAIDGLSIRLPGILARPKAPSGMKSAFMSDLFHAIKAGEPFTCPTSQQATIWAQSVNQCAVNFIHALCCETELLPRSRAVTLPAQRIAMDALAKEIAAQCNVDSNLVRWQPDEDLEAAFGAYPGLSTHAAQRLGFADDGSTARLVSSALETLA
jgi:nucleoside-diphosphate-sugar epimerase